MRITFDKKALFLLVVAVAIPCAEALSAQQQQQTAPDTRPGIAVLPFVQGISIGPNRENLDALGATLQQILTTELALNPAMRVVNRSQIRALMDEQGLGAAGRVDDATAAKIGKLTGAKFVVTGGFNDIDKQFTLDAHIVNVETSEIVRAQRVSDEREKIYSVVVDMAERLTRGLNLPPLQAAVAKDRVARSKDVSRQAIVLLSEAQAAEDGGQLVRARELYQRITTEFPVLTEAKEALRRIGGMTTSVPN